MFRENLLDIGSNRPNFWTNYAIGTLVRSLFYEEIDLIHAWADWAGAEERLFVPANPPNESSVALISDGVKAIVAFEGTRSSTQLKNEIFGGSLVAAPEITGKVNGFFLWCFRRRLTRLTDSIVDIPAGFPIVVAGASLGGALAHIAANFLIKTHRATVNGLLTFGQPKTGNQQFNVGYQGPYMRWVNEFDPVPGIIPNIGPLNILIHSHFRFPRFDGYNHAVTPQLLWNEGGWSQSSSRSTMGFWESVITSAIAPGDFADSMARHHFIGAYLTHLRFIVEAQSIKPDMQAMYDLNSEMDRLDFNQPRPPGGIASGGSWGGWTDPDLVIPLDGSMPTIPVEDVGRIVEQRRVAHSLFNFGGDPQMAHKFRSHDRRMLVMAEKVLRALQARDALVAVPKPTRKLSNRILMFPDIGTPSPQDHLNEVLIHVIGLLAAPA